MDNVPERDEVWRDQPVTPPGVPPVFSAEDLRGLFNLGTTPRPDLGPRRSLLVGRLQEAAQRLEDADQDYREKRWPRSALGDAHAWNKVRLEAEAVLNLGRAVYALVMEEEGE